MTDTIQSLSDEMLDGIVGGAQLPAGLGRFECTSPTGKTYLRISTSFSRQSPTGSFSSAGTTNIPSDKVDAYLGSLAGRGYTEVTLHAPGSSQGETMQIADIMKMYGK